MGLHHDTLFSKTLERRPNTGDAITRVYIVQHGDALSKEQDPDRPLSATGVADIEALAGVWREAHIGGARVMHSGKTRAWMRPPGLLRR